MGTSINGTPKHPAISLQEALAKYMGKSNVPAAANVATGTADALKSAQNTSGFTQIPTDSSDGKARPTDSSNRTIHLRYVPTDCDEDGMDEVSECNLGEASGPLYKTAPVTVNLRHTWGFELSKSQFRDIQESTDQGFADMVMAKYAHAKAGLNKKLIAPISGLMGKYPLTGVNSATSPIEVPVVTAAGVYNPTGIALVQSTYMQMERGEIPIIVGAGKMDFAAAAKVYSATNNDGIDATKLAANYFRDAYVNKAYADGTDNILTWMPGAIQMVEWWDNVGDFAISTTMTENGKQVYEKINTTFITPDGLKWDMYYSYDCGVHKYRFQKWFDVASIPSDAFGACQDYNYALRFKLKCGDISCSDIASATVQTFD